MAAQPKIGGSQNVTSRWVSAAATATSGGTPAAVSPATQTLHSVDTAHFRENFESGQAKLWVAIRPTGIEPALEMVGVTADPFEGEVFCENVDDVVEAVPMPAAIARLVLAFFEEHHVEREFVKRKRSEHDPRKGGARPRPGLERRDG